MVSCSCTRRTFLVHRRREAVPSATSQLHGEVEKAGRPEGEMLFRRAFVLLGDIASTRFVDRLPTSCDRCHAERPMQTRQNAWVYTAKANVYRQLRNLFVSSFILLWYFFHISPSIFECLIENLKKHSEIYFLFSPFSFHFFSPSFSSFVRLEVKIRNERNVERLVFRNFKIANIKIKKDELFDNFIFELISFFRKLFEHRKYLMIFDIVKYWFSKW